MAQFMYDTAVNAVVTQALAMTSGLKMMLVTSSYSAAKTDTSLTAAAAAEIAVSGYTGGFGGAGRKSTGTQTITNDTSANIIRVKFPANLTWTALAAGATIAAAVLVKEITNDASSMPIAYFGLTSGVPTNGSDFTLTVDTTNGNITFTV